jgi:hypothetical protein
LTERSPLDVYQYGKGYARLAGTEDWVTVTELGKGGYEWTEFKAFYSPSARRYFWHGDSGCSCNGWDDGFANSSAFEDGYRDALFRSWEEFAKNHSYTFSTTDYLAGVSEIRAFKAPKEGN